MTIKTCRNCDMRFYRDDAAPIPRDRCERCHEKIEALKVPLCADGRPCGQQDHPDEDAYCLKCPHEPKCSPDEALRNKYEREIKPGVWVDVYDVLVAWEVDNPALQHLIKKALQAGERGHKTREQDLAEIVASARRAQELEQ